MLLPYPVEDFHEQPCHSMLEGGMFERCQSRGQTILVPACGPGRWSQTSWGVRVHTPSSFMPIPSTLSMTPAFSNIPLMPSTFGPEVRYSPAEVMIS